MCTRGEMRNKQTSLLAALYKYSNLTLHRLKFSNYCLQFCSSLALGTALILADWLKQKLAILFQIIHVKCQPVPFILHLTYSRFYILYHCSPVETFSRIRLSAFNAHMRSIHTSPMNVRQSTFNLLARQQQNVTNQSTKIR